MSFVELFCEYLFAIIHIILILSASACLPTLSLSSRSPRTVYTMQVHAEGWNGRGQPVTARRGHCVRDNKREGRVCHLLWRSVQALSFVLALTFPDLTDLWPKSVVEMLNELKGFRD